MNDEDEFLQAFARRRDSNSAESKPDTAPPTTDHQQASDTAPDPAATDADTEGAVPTPEPADQAPSAADRWRAQLTREITSITPRTDRAHVTAARFADSAPPTRAAVIAVRNGPAPEPKQSTARPLLVERDLLSPVISRVIERVPVVLLADWGAAEAATRVAAAEICQRPSDYRATAHDRAEVTTDSITRGIVAAAAAIHETAAGAYGLPSTHPVGDIDLLRRLRARVRIAQMSDAERAEARLHARVRRLPSHLRESALRDARDRQRTADASAIWRRELAAATQRYPFIRAVLSSGHDAAAALLTTCGLDRKTTTPRHNPDGSTTALTTVACPTLDRVDLTKDGIQLAFSPLAGQSLETWKSAAGALSTELRSPVSVSQDADHIHVSIRDRAASGLPDTVQLHDPADLLIQRTESVSVDRRGTQRTTTKSRMYVPVGVRADGQTVSIELTDQNGAVVGGISGSGKTAFLKAALSALVGRAEFIIFDGKGEEDWEPFRPYARAFDNSGLDLAGPAADMIDHVIAIREQRGAALKRFRETHGISAPSASFWDLPIEQREAAGLYPIVVVFDEVQVLLEKQRLSKADAEIQAAIESGLASLVRLGRSAGIYTILATQKPTADTVPTRIRDNVATRICLRVGGRTAAEAVLDRSVYDRAPILPDRIPTNRRGRAVVFGTDTGETEAVQGHYIPDFDLTAYWEDNPPTEVPDQLTVGQRLLG